MYKKNISLGLPNEFLSNKKQEKLKILSFKQYQCHICSLNKIIKQNKFQSNCTKMKFVDWGSAFLNILKIYLWTDAYYLIFISIKEIG